MVEKKEQREGVWSLLNTSLRIYSSQDQGLVRSHVELTCLEYLQHRSCDGVESSRNGTEFPAPSESSTLTQMGQNKSLPVHQHIFPISLPEHDSSTLERFISHPSQRVTTGNVCVSVWAGQVYRAGSSTITSPASVGSQHLLNSNVHSRHMRDTDSQCYFAAHRLLWTLTRLQKRSVQVEQNPPLKPCQIWWWTAVLDLLQQHWPPAAV